MNNEWYKSDAWYEGDDCYEIDAWRMRYLRRQTSNQVAMYNVIANLTVNTTGSSTRLEAAADCRKAAASAAAVGAKTCGAAGLA